jgi:hypothetical protein
MDIWIVSILHLLLTVLLWILVSRFCVTYISFLWVHNRGGIARSYGNFLCLTFWGIVRLFSKVTHHFKFSTAVFEGSNLCNCTLVSTSFSFSSSSFSHPFSPPFLFIIPILMSVNWYFIVLFICTFLVDNHVSIFSCTLLAICILCWGKCLCPFF